ncbi:MAG: hypothetical protein AAF490_31360, partial [Chloroflexota bacterium]
ANGSGKWLVWVGIGALSGVLLAPVLTGSIPMMRVLATPTAETFRLVLILTAGMGVLFVPGLVAYCVVGGRGTAVFTTALAGLLMGILTPYFWDSLLSMTLTGLIAEGIIALITRYQPGNGRLLATIGAILGVLAAGGSFLGHGSLGLTGWQSVVVVGTAVVTSTLFALLAYAISRPIRSKVKNDT